MPEKWLRNEQKERSQEHKILKQLEGYKKLSAKQQQMMRLSLYLEDRRARPNPPSPHNYLDSFAARKWWMCFVAISDLEREKAEPHVELKVPELPKPLLNEWARAEYIEHENPTIEEVEALINTQEFPCVVVESMPRDGMEKFPSHGILVLGRDKKGELITWEKRMWEGSFSIGSFKETFETWDLLNNDGVLYWGVRPFEVKKGA
jgi:hypothetical protein